MLHIHKIISIIKPYSSRMAAQKSNIFKKSAITGHRIKAADKCIPPFHILGKKDIEKELSNIEKEFGMTHEEFHKAYREGKIHGHEAMKLDYYYEFYKDEYE